MRKRQWLCLGVAVLVLLFCMVDVSGEDAFSRPFRAHPTRLCRLDNHTGAVRAPANTVRGGRPISTLLAAFGHAVVLPSPCCAQFLRSAPQQGTHRPSVLTLMRNHPLIAPPKALA